MRQWRGYDDGWMGGVKSDVVPGRMKMTMEVARG